MTSDTYQRLARHLDKLPGGFPPSETGVEYRILKRLFTPAEAEFALHLTLIPEEPKVIAQRAKISTREAALMLETMAKKGLIYRITSKGKQPSYMAMQYVIGIWEFHVNDLDEALVKDMEEYIPTLMKESWKIPQLRTIPVNKSISTELPIMTYENAAFLVQHVKKAAVAPCICRREQKLVGKGCDKAEETCLVFGRAADYYLQNGLAREIDQQEVLNILSLAEKEGLVLQPSNSKKISNICCCCGDCCGVLRNLKTFPKPASVISSPFYATADSEACSGCGICLERCQMDAIQFEDESASVDLDRCIGCGLCVSTCPTSALALVRKADAEQPAVPQNNIQAAIELGRSRGKFNFGNLMVMQLKSKFDRLLSLSSRDDTLT